MGVEELAAAGQGQEGSGISRLMTNSDDDIAAGHSPQQPDIGLGATFQGQVFPYQGPVERRRLRGATRPDPGFAATIRLDHERRPFAGPSRPSEED